MDARVVILKLTYKYYFNIIISQVHYGLLDVCQLQSNQLPYILLSRVRPTWQCAWRFPGDARALQHNSSYLPFCITREPPTLFEHHDLWGHKCEHSTDLHGLIRDQNQATAFQLLISHKIFLQILVVDVGQPNDDGLVAVGLLQVS